MNETQEAEKIRQTVREGYAEVARGGGCCGPSKGATPASSPEDFAARLGYSNDQLEMLPDGSNMGLSCGNPTAIAALQAGQVVVDLGSGGGLDCFLAGPKVGPSGRVIGVDMTAEMLTRARQNTTAYTERTGLENVEFRLGEIEHLPIADGTVDVVLSNCVINLSPDKPQVWREVARVLKPGGRVVVSDVALHKPLPESLKSLVASLIGCVSGALRIDDCRAVVEAAGLQDVQLEEQPGFVEAVVNSDDPLYTPILAQLPPETSLADYVTSVTITATKPGGTCCGG